MSRYGWIALCAFISGCAGDVRFERPGAFVVPTPAAPARSALPREEVFRWAQPSGEAWFFWISPDRARAGELFRGLSFGASHFALQVAQRFSGTDNHWLPCNWTACLPQSEKLGFDVDVVKAFFLNEGRGSPSSGRLPNFFSNVQRVIERLPPRWQVPRWVHVLVTDVGDLEVGMRRQDGDEARWYWDYMQALMRKLNSVDGFSRARFQYTFAYFPENGSQDRCARLPLWEGHFWSLLRRGAGFFTQFAEDLDVCDIVHGDEAPMRRLAQDAETFQTRLILARKVADESEMQVEADGRLLRREDFDYDPRSQEVKIHDSIAHQLSVGASIRVHYHEVLE